MLLFVIGLAEEEFHCMIKALIHQDDRIIFLGRGRPARVTCRPTFNSNLILYSSLDVRTCGGECDITVCEEDALELSAPLIDSPTGRQSPIEGFTISPANIPLIVGHKSGRKIERPLGNAEGYAGVQINKASAGESLSLLIAADGCGKRGADFTRDFSVKHMALAKFLLDPANLVIRKNVGHEGDLKSHNQ